MIVGSGGGGQAAELGDAGGCGRPIWATFLHEFGHQVGLSHSGGPGPAFCPTYTSLMSYAFSYGFEDDYHKIHYSCGSRTDLEVNEARLSERLPVPFEKLAHLAKGPYRFKIEKDGDGTRVDWNRNGVFDAAPVKADVTDVYGADGGRRCDCGKTTVGPALVVHRNEARIFLVDRAKKCFTRSIDGEDKYGAPLELPHVAATGDLAAASDGTTLVLLAPVAEGVVAVSGTTIEEVAASRPTPIPASKGAAISACVREGEVHALLWTAADSPVHIASRGADGAWSTSIEIEGLRSAIPPGAVADPDSAGLLIGYGGLEKTGDREKRDWRVATATKGTDGVWKLGVPRVVGGKAGWYGSSRPTLLIEGSDGVAPGRLHFMARGGGPNDPTSCFYEAITIGDRTQDDGWRLRRFYDEWTQTKSPLSAVLHGGDLILAYRWAGNVHGDEDDNLHVAHRGFGVTDAPMRDHDDVASIAEVGLARSIPYRHPTVK
jgi:hypothetical protein